MFGPTLVVGPEGRWFFAHGAAAPVSLETRKGLRRILEALLLAHASRGALDSDALIQAGWPGERLIPCAAKNRLAVALSTLRTMGLREALRHDARGWSIDASWRVHRAPTLEASGPLLVVNEPRLAG